MTRTPPSVHVLRVLVVLGLTALTAPLGSDAPPPAAESAVEADLIRPPDQTFLTYPEWYLVWSPREYAAFIADRPPSEFPYFGHTKQLWSGYRMACRATAEHPFNGEYHFMIWVIGVSSTVEYLIKLGYESFIGRFLEILRSGPTPEDEWAARAAQEYVDFLDESPWYYFDYRTRLAQLWSLPWWGPDMLRKWERRAFLTAEYAFKMVYGWLIKRGSQASFDTPAMKTLVQLDRLPPEAEAELPRLEVVERRPDGTALVTLPRYAPFAPHALTLARHGAAFQEVAGNTSPILITALVPRGWRRPTGAAGELLFRESILTQPELERVAVSVPVPDLAGVLLELGSEPASIEHVYDF